MRIDWAGVIISFGSGPRYCLDLEEELDFLEFVVENNEGRQLRFHGWEENIRWIVSKIQVGKTVLVTNASSMEMGEYYQGNMPFEGYIHENTSVDVLRNASAV